MSGSTRPRDVARHFKVSAGGYDRVADFQRTVADGLLQRLPPLPPGARVLDVGAGTGFVAERLGRDYGAPEVVAVDLVHEMLKEARIRFQGPSIQADAEQLPIKARCCDLVVSNLCLQWCPSFLRAMTEFGRVLRPGGQLLISTLGPATLTELKSAWSAVDRFAHVIDFESVSTVIEGLKTAGFGEIELEVQSIQRHYPSVLALLKELKQLGARNASSLRSTRLTSPRQLAAMMARYQESERLSTGEIPATFEVILVRATKPRGT